MLSDTGSTEFVVKYVVYHLPTIAAILFYCMTTMKAVQQLSADRSNIRWSNEQAF